MTPSRIKHTPLYSFTIICLRNFFWSGSFAGLNCGTALLPKRNMMSGCGTFLPPPIAAESQSLSGSGADNEISPQHRISLCDVGGLFFAPCQELYALLPQSKNGIVLMTLPFRKLQVNIISTVTLRGADVPYAFNLGTVIIYSSIMLLTDCPPIFRE